VSVLVTGGAGYIGSHMAHLLARGGSEVVVADNLQSGHADAVPPGARFYQVDVGIAADMVAILREHRIRTIFHFASRIQVGESVVNPRLYYTGNLAAAVGLLEAALEAGVENFILSSTAAVYGIPAEVPIPEDHPTRPINPYGDTKLAIERMLESYSSAYGLRFAALRYFNAAGADASAGLGERHEPETHLIPLVLQAALGERANVAVFGRDYPTADGTCVRDYIHVLDLAEAHLAALKYLQGGGASGAFNLGTGTGFSVQQVIEAARSVSGRDIPVVDAERRAGDPPALVANPRRAEQLFGWKARRSDLHTIIRDAWSWHARSHAPDRTPVASAP
jgi:UDP-glucose 4-epimerase